MPSAYLYFVNGPRAQLSLPCAPKAGTGASASGWAQEANPSLSQISFHHCMVTNAAGAGPNVPSEALDAAKAQILDVSFKNCGEFWGSVYKKLNPLDFTPTGEFQFKNLKMTVEGDRMPLTEAQKMNGIQWMGLINFSADVSRERSIGAKDWSPWNDGFGAPYNTILISIVNGKVTMNGGTALRADCPQ